MKQASQDAYTYFETSAQRMKQASQDAYTYFEILKL